MGVVYDTSNPALPGRLALIAVFGIIATGLVGLRFKARHITRTGHELDDWMVLLTLLLYFGALAGCVWANLFGWSNDPEEVSLEKVVNSFKAAYMVLAFSMVCITTAKLSILHFYKRIFSPKKRFLLIINIVIGFCMAWCIAATLVVIFACSPIEKAWNPLIQGQCIGLTGFLTAIEIINTIIDIIMVALPVNIIRSLHLQLRLKIAIAAIFCLGALTGVAGLIKVGMLYKPPFDLSLIGMLTSLQLLLAVFCACLPVLRPLLPSNATVFDAFHGFKSSLRLMRSNLTRKSTKATLGSSNTSKDASQAANSFSRHIKHGGKPSDESISMVRFMDSRSLVITEESDIEANQDAKISIDGGYKMSYPFSHEV